MDKIVKLNSYKRRIVDEKIEKYLKTVGAICIEGPKWCGKTWTSSYHSNSEFLVADPHNNFENRSLAELSINYALEGDTPRLIDEWQEIPSIWDAVRHEVDRRDKKGQFILTGSSTPIVKGILHSGAGRIAKIRMHTMSLYESNDSTGKISLYDLCNENFEAGKNKEISIEELARLIVRGGWPSNIEIPKENISILPSSYIETIIDDARRIDNIKYDINKMHKLLLSLARNESTTASQNKIINDLNENDQIKIETETISNYLSIFERLFIIENQLPFLQIFALELDLSKRQKDILQILL